VYRINKARALIRNSNDNVMMLGMWAVEGCYKNAEGAGS
jgi:hypothetical protein